MTKREGNTQISRSSLKYIKWVDLFAKCVDIRCIVVYTKTNILLQQMIKSREQVACLVFLENISVTEKSKCT